MRRHSHSLRRGPEDAGFTLVELLVTVVIMGTAFVVLVGGTLTGVIASNTHREKADGEIVLRRFIDYVKAAPFSPCPGNGYVPTAATEPTEYWVDTLEKFTLTIRTDLPDADPPAEEDGCVTLVSTPPSAALQRLSLVVEVNTGGPPDPRSRQSVQILKRGTS